MKKIIAATLVIAILATTILSPNTFAASESFDFTDDEPIDAAVFAETDSVPAAVMPEISAPSAILIEKETGTVIYEKDADTQREPASVTKVMTILLIVEAIESERLSFDDMVSASANAASMGGSQVYLKEGEQMTVHDMLKSIIVVSANDCSVAMAEYLAGSEEAFVALMNERAEQLGMKNTHFTNCTGLLDDPEHLTTARDISIMSRELIKHDMVKEFTTIWMDSIRNGEFGLSNTNKLIYYYDGATGLKTGFTSRSMYCLSATAMRDGVEYIAVVMHCETSPKRFADAKALLSYGFANYELTTAEPDSVLPPIHVSLGETEYVQPIMESTEKLLISKNDKSNITRQVTISDELTAPVESGQTVGELVIKNGDTILGTYPIVAGDSVPRLTWGKIFTNFLRLIYAEGL